MVVTRKKTMAANRKMSLVARFDDLSRYTSVLNESLESEFQAFVLNQEECRKRWLQCELERQRLEMLYNKDKKDLEGTLEYCRKMYSQEIKKRKSAEQERDSFRAQLDLIKEILLDSNAVNDQTREKLAFLNNNTLFPSRRFESPQHLGTIDESGGSILSPSDIDITEEDLDAPSMRSRSRIRISGHDGKKRPSAPPLSDDTPPKKSKVNEINAIAEGTDSVIATTTVTVPYVGPIIASSKIEALGGNVKMNRSHSDPVPPTQHPETPLRVPMKSEGDRESDESLEWMETGLTPRPAFTTPLTRNTLKRSRFSLGKASQRPHEFISKTVIKREKCIVCDKRLKFGKLALRCKDCRTTCHVDCKGQIPLPCTPVTVTPSAKNLLGCVIADFAPKVPPLIPALILHCVMEVESRGLKEIGLYRVPGSEREVRELKEKFLRGKGIPKLTKVDIHAICGCIKDFLRSLKEPLVTFALWRDFVQAAEVKNENLSLEKLKIAVEKLPFTNRDTLAYLIMHLQLVAKSPACKMTTFNLARVFGPTIVGYSSSDLEPAALLHETKYQAPVIERLMQISQDYWASFINVPTEHPPVFATPETPEPRPVPENIFGPITPSGSRSSLRNFISHTPLGPRDGLKTRSYKRQQKFFASPMLQ